MVTTARSRVDERVGHHDEKHLILVVVVPGEVELHLPTAGRYQRRLHGNIPHRGVYCKESI